MAKDLTSVGLCATGLMLIASAALPYSASKFYSNRPASSIELLRTYDNKNIIYDYASKGTVGLGVGLMLLGYICRTEDS